MVKMRTQLAIERAGLVTLHLQPARRSSIPTIEPQPVRVSAVAQSSAGISWVQIWVDGTKTLTTEHYSGTADVKMWSNYICLADGKHTITVVAKQGDGTSLKSTHSVQVVSYTP
jgi:hypothetical protein